ncbi:MAG TPA: MerR family transcriptional regulator [bacterium]|nr:MerR family transcriptional regulator [bacterium]HQG47130.1 MerR family transcriptional regulator [bacterium]HQI49567.1 MerR family transcriptional regulator [bacterium]HQJ64767.1 MerR family transcriptional regulator [bacterium]
MEQLSLFYTSDEQAQPQVTPKMEEKAIKRLYYSIAEVSRITGLKPYVLRYWETEFRELRPAKNRAGNRIYRKNDIRLLFVIKRLLYYEKYTIEGARQKLAQIKRSNDAQLNLSLYEAKSQDVIEELRHGLRELAKLLDDLHRGVAQSG